MPDKDTIEKLITYHPLWLKCIKFQFLEKEFLQSIDVLLDYWFFIENRFYLIFQYEFSHFRFCLCNLSQKIKFVAYPSLQDYMLKYYFL